MGKKLQFRLLFGSVMDRILLHRKFKNAPDHIEVPSVTAPETAFLKIPASGEPRRASPAIRSFMGRPPEVNLLTIRRGCLGEATNSIGPQNSAM